jgi:hypothetical protein
LLQASCTLAAGTRLLLSLLLLLLLLLPVLVVLVAVVSSSSLQWLLWQGGVALWGPHSNLAEVVLQLVYRHTKLLTLLMC